MIKEITARLEEIKANQRDWVSLTGVKSKALSHKDMEWLITELEQSLKREAELVAENDKLKGDVMAAVGKLNRIRFMKDDKFTKWNLWHVANTFFNEIDKNLHFPCVVDIYTNHRASQAGKGET